MFCTGHMVSAGDATFTPALRLNLEPKLGKLGAHVWYDGAGARATGAGAADVPDLEGNLSDGLFWEPTLRPIKGEFRAGKRQFLL